MTENRPLLLRAAQVATTLNIAKSTVWKWTKEGKLPPPIKWQGITVWRMRDLEDLVDELR